MNFLTNSQTPVYVKAATGFFTAVRSLPAGQLVEFVRTGIDDKSERPIGYLATGEILYTDTLTRVLDEVETKSTRLWDWLIGIGLVAAGGYAYYKYKNK